MKIQSGVILFLVLSFAACDQKKSPAMNDDVDPDIVLVNIEKGDRAFIANLIRTVDSCKPAVIAMDVRFVYSKGYEEDSILVEAFKATPNDIVAYTVDPDEGIKQSHLRFRSFFEGEGMSVFEGGESGLRMQPLRIYNDEVHESFELRIVRQWKPGYRNNFKPGQSIAIDLKRPLEKFLHFDINSLRENRDQLKNKIVILGYLGPDNEDKHFTPMRKRFKDHPANEPDTYGAVIVANIIRTLLEYKNRW